MKTRCELSEQELRKLLDKKTINLPPVKSRTAYLIILGSVMVMTLITAFTINGSFNSGYEKGHDEGYQEGYNSQNNYEGLTIKQALASNIKHNLDNYIAWFGLVVGLGWVLHGVGFKLAG